MDPRLAELFTRQRGRSFADLRGAQARFPARPPERRHGLRGAIHADDDPPDTGLSCHDDPYQFANSDPPGRPATAFLSGFLQPLLTVSDPRPGEGLLTRGANAFMLARGASREPAVIVLLLDIWVKWIM